MKPRYLTSGDAAERLSVERATLYSYVSRGLIRSIPAPGGRSRLYVREDVEKLRRRQDFRRDPERQAETTLGFGSPILDSALPLTETGRLFYRGRDACELARTAHVEQVATLIWTGEWSSVVEPLLGAGDHRVECPPAFEKAIRGLEPTHAYQVVLPFIGPGDVAAFDLRPPAILSASKRIVDLLVRLTATGRHTGAGGSCAVRLAAAWAPERPEATRLIEASLILCADHELNVSTFTARCVASARATPYQVVSAGLAALTGTRHGGYGEQVAALFREIESTGDVARAIADRLRRGDSLPGFGHPLYPDGDPRATCLFELLAAADPRSPALALANEVVEQVAHHTGDRPNLDLGLVTVARVQGLPRGSALALFALGRTIGWLGQAMEQYERDRLIRPRARYVGPPPVEP